MPNLVATCAPDNVDATTGACSHIEWVNYAGGLPPLTAAEGSAISALVIATWTIGFLVRRARQTIDEE